MIDTTQADYNQLETIAGKFGQLADSNTALHSRLAQTSQQLKGGGWAGAGAVAFLNEMEGEIFPALQRLTQALEQAQTTTRQSSDTIRAAEEEAAGLFGTENDEVDKPNTIAKPLTIIPSGGLPARPNPPPAPEEGDGSGTHGNKKRNLAEKLFDESQRQLWYRVADAADAVGMDDAARNMRHYLNNSGKNLSVSPEDILSDLPDFKKRADIAFQADIVEVANQKIASEYNGEPMGFQLTSEWRNYGLGQPNGSDQFSNEGNWFYALGTFGYSYGADVVVIPGANDQPEVQIEYQMHIFDRYNWDAGKGVDIAGLPTPDTALGHLHQVGIAHEYEIWGSSKPSTITYTHPEVNLNSNPGLPDNGSETRDKLIHRQDRVSRTDPRLDFPDRNPRNLVRDMSRS